MMEKKDLSFLHGTVLNFDFWCICC
jgi:hypothetical protein